MAQQIEQIMQLADGDYSGIAKILYPPLPVEIAKVKVTKTTKSGKKVTEYVEMPVQAQDLTPFARTAQHIF